MQMELPKRKATRLKNYDYSLPAAYFITICVQNKLCILSKVTDDGELVLKSSGKIAANYIETISDIFPNIKVHKYVIMPNHIHLILLVYENNGKLSYNSDSKYNDKESIVEAIGWFKYMTTKDINLSLKRQYSKVFQRSYHDHIIRGQKDYQKIWEYIQANPVLWKKDCFYPTK